VTDRTTLHRLDRTGLLVFSGADAQSFLQGQLSCDVDALTPDNSTYGSYCTPKGRMLATFLLWRAGPDFVMQLPAALRESIQKRISMFILRSRVTVTDASSTFARFGIAGPAGPTAMTEVFGAVPAAAHEVKQIEGATLTRLPTDRFEVVVASEKASRTWDALKIRTEESDETTWEWLDIRAGIPWITPETQDAFVPQMVNLDLIGGVSFSKGCYPGQEIVARAHYRGQVKQRMHLVHIETQIAPTAGDKLYSADMGGQSSGTVINVAPAPTGAYDALAVIHAGSVETSDVRWKTPDGPLSLLPLPYGPQ
jgi:folate-binding protein YgfZ